MSKRSKLHPVLDLSKSEASPFGLGYWDTVLECARKAQLDKQHPPDPDTPLPKALEIGILYHLFLELYFSETKDFECSRIQIRSVHSADARAEAEKLFRAFRVRYKNSDFGRIIACEKTYTEEINALGAGSYSDPPLEFTIKPDLVTKVTKTTTAKLKKLDRIVLTPGYWLWDWKTAGFVDGKLRYFYEHGLRAFAYQIVWNMLHPKQALQGAVFHVVTKTNPVKFVPMVIRKPTVHDRKRFESYLYSAADTLGTYGLDRETNPSACVTWRETCRHYGENCTGV